MMVMAIGASGARSHEPSKFSKVRTPITETVIKMISDVINEQHS